MSERPSAERIGACLATAWDNANPFNKTPHQCGLAPGHTGPHQCGAWNGKTQCGYQWARECVETTEAKHGTQ